MPAGRFPYEYFKDPHIQKPIEQIYQDINGYTWETTDDDSELWHGESFIQVVLPPLQMDGLCVKGIFYSNAVDVILRRYPWLSDLFHTIGSSMFSSYSWSRKADVLFSVYNNPHRDNWFRNQEPARHHQLLFPLLDSDFLNELTFCPLNVAEKDIDVLCISRLNPDKNLEVVAKAIQILNKKYNASVRMTLITGQKMDLNLQYIRPNEREEFYKIESAVEHFRDYIDVVLDRIFDPTELARYYSRAKVCVLGSLLEGRNRCIREAISCNTPVVCFKQLNQYARGDQPELPDGAAMYAPEFDAEILADTLYEALNHRDSFHPRKAFLRHFGRKTFLNQCLNLIPHYREVLPDFSEYDNYSNDWLNMAIYQQYEKSFHDLLYDKQVELTYAKGMNNIEAFAENFGYKFGILKKEVKPILR